MKKIWTCFVLLLFGTGASASTAYADGTISSCGTVIPSSATGTWAVARDLTAAASCVTIQGSGIAVDLRGHTITGTGAGMGITDGASCFPGPSCQQNIIIANGTIQGFEEGVALRFTEYVTISNLNVTGNSFGIVIEQDHAVVTQSQAGKNATMGIFLSGNNQTVVSSQANNNLNIGMDIEGANSTITNSQANNN
jgi:hypothetical protein